MFRLESGTGSLNSFVSTWSRNRGDILQPQTYLFSLSSTVITFPIEIWEASLKYCFKDLIWQMIDMKHIYLLYSHMSIVEDQTSVNILHRGAMFVCMIVIPICVMPSRWQVWITLWLPRCHTTLPHHYCHFWPTIITLINSRILEQGIPSPLWNYIIVNVCVHVLFRLSDKLWQWSSSNSKSSLFYSYLILKCWYQCRMINKTTITFTKLLIEMLFRLIRLIQFALKTKSWS